MDMQAILLALPPPGRRHYPPDGLGWSHQPAGGAAAGLRALAGWPPACRGARLTWSPCSASQADAEAAFSGRQKCQPWPAWQPMPSSAAAMAALSTPSATDLMPSAAARSTIDLTTTKSSGDSSSLPTNDASTLTSVTGSRLSRTSDE